MRVFKAKTPPKEPEAGDLWERKPGSQPAKEAAYVKAVSDGLVLYRQDPTQGEATHSLSKKQFVLRFFFRGRVQWASSMAEKNPAN